MANLKVWEKEDKSCSYNAYNGRLLSNRTHKIWWWQRLW